jgi:hypothetical protein
VASYAGKASGDLRHDTLAASYGEVNDLTRGLFGKLFQPTNLRIVISPKASRVQNMVAAVSADDTTVCV